MIDETLAADADPATPTKRRPTAGRIFDWFRDEQAYAGGGAVVRRYVAEHRRVSGEVFVNRAGSPENLDRRCLAGSVWAEQREDLAAGDREVDAPDNLRARIGLHQAANIHRESVGISGLSRVDVIDAHGRRLGRVR